MVLISAFRLVALTFAQRNTYVMYRTAYLIIAFLITQTSCSNIPTLPSETVIAITASTVGFTPKPTKIPTVRNIFDRQAYFSTCAYYSGVLNS